MSMVLYITYHANVWKFWSVAIKFCKEMGTYPAIVVAV